ncbi:hypothetical protein BH11ACT4_BH11ACT4_22460 [soil metagenome]
MHTAYWPGGTSDRAAADRAASLEDSVGTGTYSVGVDDSPLVFESDYEFAPVIVWDALLDSDLVSGWLAEASITPEVGGEYNLRWVHRPGRPATLGRITVLQPPERLRVDTSDSVHLAFELRELPIGNRGSSTRLRVTVAGPGDAAELARVKADWLTNLDQLDDLLRGHPVDWPNWDHDRHDAWFRHLGEAENSTA